MTTRRSRRTRPSRRNAVGNPFFIFRTLLTHESNIKMEELSKAASKMWKLLPKEEKEVYHLIYEIVTKRYTLDNIGDGSQLVILKYNPHGTVGRNQEPSYPILKEIYDKLLELKSSNTNSAQTFEATPRTHEVVVDPSVYFEVTGAESLEIQLDQSYYFDVTGSEFIDESYYF